MDENPVVLVTGGAGYIGSHAVLALKDAGFPVVVFDNLSTGIRSAVPDGVPLIEGDIADTEHVAEVIRGFQVGAIMHFAGSIVVSESVEKPLKYYRNNTQNSLGLIETCVRLGVKHFIFSSTAAVYGEPEAYPIDEESPTRPINPYGQSKLMTEHMLRDASAAHGLNTGILRYFNVAGADPAGRAGQNTPAATHLIKVAVQAALGLRPAISVFGTDYDTPDGTCIRDYIHVSDLADAHVLALRHLVRKGGNLLVNCAYGRGFSVREVLKAVEKVIGRPLPVNDAPRRAGDPPALVAKADRIHQLLGWKPAHDSLEEMVETALAWERRMAEDTKARRAS
ncbi:UDP-glucose 4-epimerase GalE [Skermanella mucosa]|uniref:UDP-glucose 4-epimerase GalE n=1 Tax=Skermanella mucosa TaxID=1789672 RepID=UPI00192BA88E|nr:UDP-glucose 4-epimerase GalE [Skermanella mucosa]UEM22919.1 UDP-glucose 4-epimerase GalE [Skermanella mucosa]